jgi:hypothetical protein
MDKLKTALKRSGRHLDDNDASPAKLRSRHQPHMAQVTDNISPKAKHGKHFNTKETKHLSHNSKTTKGTPKQPDRQTPSTSKQPDRQTPSTSKQPDRQTPSTSKQPDRQVPSTSKRPDRQTPSTSKQPDRHTAYTGKHAPHIAEPEFLNKPYKVIEYRTRYIKKYAAEEMIYQVKFAREWQHRTLGDLQDSFFNMFEDIVKRLKRRYDLDSKVRLFIQHPDLKYSSPIFIALRPLRDLTVEAIMNIMERVINSNLNVALNRTFRVDIGIIRPPNGNGKMKLTCAELDHVMNERFYKRSMVVIPNIENDHTCAARAVVVAMANLRNDKNYSNLRNPKRYVTQLKYARALLYDVNLPEDRAIDISQFIHFETYYNVQIIVYQRPIKDGILYAGHQECDDKIFLYYNKGHFDVISNITGFLNVNNYCSHCLIPYSKSHNHVCDMYCNICERDKCQYSKEHPDGLLSCFKCRATCRSMECYLKHKESPDNGTASLCDTYIVCKKCHKRLGAATQADHICGTYTCSNCQKDNVDRAHLCYMRAIPAPMTSGKFLYYDFECMAGKIHECKKGYKSLSQADCTLCKDTGLLCSSCASCVNCQLTLCGKYIHQPCLVVAQTTCDACKDAPLTEYSTCNECGSRCDHCHVLIRKTRDDPIVNPCPGRCGQRQTIYSGANAGEHFAEWLFTRNHSNFTCIAHNSKSYDCVILLNHILSNTYHDVKCIYSGSKIICMSLPEINIRLIDSMNFLPMALKKLPKIFGLEDAKGDFPHLFNVEENQNYVGPFPDIKYFDIDSKSTAERADFIKWHETQKDKIFNFQEEILKYCITDVDILREACSRFRAMVLKLTADKAVSTTPNDETKEDPVTTNPAEAKPASAKPKKKRLLKVLTPSHVPP